MSRGVDQDNDIYNQETCGCRFLYFPSIWYVIINHLKHRCHNKYHPARGNNTVLREVSNSVCCYSFSPSLVLPSCHIFGNMQH